MTWFKVEVAITVLNRKTDTQAAIFHEVKGSVSAHFKNDQV